MALTEEPGFKMIEACAQVHGALYKGWRAGSIGNVGARSFCQDKIMTLIGGEGGMATTNDPLQGSAMWSNKDHGNSFEAVGQRAHQPGFRWPHASFGTNWRMTEMQAVIDRIELRLAEGGSRYRTLEEVNPRGVPCMERACSKVYIEKAFGNTGRRPAAPLPVARRLGQTSIMFLVHPAIEDSHIDTAVDAIHEVLGQAGKKRAGRVTEATARTYAPFLGNRPARNPRSRARAARVLGWADQLQLPC